MLTTLTRSTVLALAMAALVFAQPAAAGGRSATETIAINNQVTLLSPTTVLVVVSMSCTPFGFTFGEGGVDETGSVSVFVNQSDIPATGSGFNAAVPCDGHSHDVQVLVNGAGFHIGDAIVRAQGCNFSCDTDQRQARVVSP